ncbi:pentapeptide repeat-containing protein [Oculatella sp. LEGE 06141]|uniref:pentapeptide repeat-containing protein n=1 Tax=Oculatella sp. LEGE 06141 TaxID=1828648 RepID=UPI00187DFF80|nr:pentapeptide repeat-containing protein [Oculatella sp. LEGE 06141]MBE9181499.1 pentapeptide repeat-containing protein [Oculatella sp. LEGE 06141]
MKLKLLFVLTLASVGLVTPAQAENVQHTQQLMNSRECQRCDLREVGLVYANLSGANLQEADLSLGNLAQIDLRNANLRGANLAGAVLFSADLRGADLTGADLRGADLRGAQMGGVVLEAANLEGANLVGAFDIPSQILTAEDLYMWGLAEAQRGNFRGAIAYYNQSIGLKPEFPHAYLARGISRFRLSDEPGALQDAERAEQLYLAQQNEQGQLAATRFSEGLQALQEAEARGSRGRGGNFLNFLGSLSTVLLRFLF